MGYDVPPVPETLIEDLAYNLGEVEARRWLVAAREVAGRLIAQWQLVPHQVLPGGSMSLCVKCADPEGRELVLKVPTDVAGGAAETAALRAWAGDGAPRLLREDPATSAMLMGFLGWVGEGSYELGDIVDLSERLHTAAVDGFPFGSVQGNLDRRIHWARTRFGEDGCERHRRDLDGALRLLQGLLDDDGAQEAPVLLHGDLQAKNLIVCGDRLTAVDPLPVLGPPVFDLAFWIAKSVHEHPTATYLDRVCELRPGTDRDRLVRWTWALAVLENRPALPRGREQRQEFIDGLRPEVLASV